MPPMRPNLTQRMWDLVLAMEVDTVEQQDKLCVLQDRRTAFLAGLQIQ